MALSTALPRRGRPRALVVSTRVSVLVWAESLSMSRSPSSLSRRSRALSSLISKPAEAERALLKNNDNNAFFWFVFAQREGQCALSLLFFLQSSIKQQSHSSFLPPFIRSSLLFGSSLLFPSCFHLDPN
mmetsp:Transcript_11287/g.19074  ORF Transcript_11287/g.19074 Transcript_11287/m.19074 type:complete len:129 (+) Transcript_11287:509-895(+)